MWLPLPEIMQSVLPVVLYIQPCSESLDRWPYLTEGGQTAILSWLLSRICLLAQSRPLGLVEWRPVAGKSRPLAVGDGLRKFTTVHRSEVQALAEVATLLDSNDLCVVDLTSALAPLDLIDRLELHHRASDNALTFMNGLPAMCSPVIYRTSVLQAVAKSALPGLPDDPMSAILSLGEAARLVGEELSFSTQGVPLDASMEYKSSRSELPDSVRFDAGVYTAVTLTVIRLIEAGKLTADELEPLKAWKRLLIDEVKVKRKSIERKAFVDSSQNVYDGNRKRILFASVASAFSGGEHNLCRTIGCLDRGRYQLLAYVGRRGLFQRTLERAGCNVIVAEDEFGACTADNFLQALGILRELRPDVVHANASIGCPFLYAARLLGVPFVQHVRLLDVSNYTDAISNASAVVAVSRAVQEAIMELNVPREKVHVVYNGIDLHTFNPELFEKAAIRHELGLSENALVALVVSRYTRDKHHDIMLQACSQIASAVPSLHLIFAGEVFDQAAVYEDVLRLAHSLEIADRITFLGFESNIQELYAAADVVVLPSEREALGTCILEGMAMGLPVVITASGGLIEVVRHGVDGFVVPPRDHVALSNALVAILADASLRRLMGDHGRARIQDQFTSEASARALSNVFDSVIQTCSPREVLFRDKQAVYWARSAYVEQ